MQLKNPNQTKPSKQASNQPKNNPHPLKTEGKNKTKGEAAADNKNTQSLNLLTYLLTTTGTTTITAAAAAAATTTTTTTVTNATTTTKKGWNENNTHGIILKQTKQSIDQ